LLIKISAGFLFGAVYSSLLLLGWGLGDIECFFSHPARIIVFAVTLCSFAVGALFKDKSECEFFRKGKGEKPREKILGVYLPSLIGFLLPVLVPYSESHDFLIINGSDLLRYLGLALFLSGFVFMLWGPLHMGRQYSILVTIQDGHKLITDGPFRYMRHPRYSGIIQWVFGLALVFPSAVSLALAAAMAALILIRIPKEELLLEGAFGDNWRDYCSRTRSRVVPFVY